MLRPYDGRQWTARIFAAGEPEQDRQLLTVAVDAGVYLQEA
jgi:hypothetical protein